jgi:hypothetical protein
VGKTIYGNVGGDIMNSILHDCWSKENNLEVHLTAYDGSYTYVGTVEGARSWLWLNKGIMFVTTVVMDGQVILLPDIRL